MLGGLDARQRSLVVDLQAPDTDMLNPDHGDALAVEVLAKLVLDGIARPDRKTALGQSRNFGPTARIDKLGFLLAPGSR